MKTREASKKRCEEEDAGVIIFNPPFRTESVKKVER
jgi:hypothetical protein